MSKRNLKSRELIERAQRVDAALLSRPGVLANALSVNEDYPIFAERANGAYVWDVDGNRYIDFVLAFGCIVLGHAHSGVTEAVVKTIQDGVSPTLAHRRQIELAERLVDIIPGAELATFFRTGSDATTAAVRLARAFTGRNYVARWGYHGWHDWCAPRPAGVIPALREFTLGFEYNDVHSVKSVFEAHGSDIACLIMMPYEVELPNPGFLEEIRDITSSYGTLLVFDEVRSGFRLALGGAQEYFGVNADMITLSKAMSNGHPVSAVVGKRGILSRISDTSMSSTFFRGPDGMAAALATIDILERNSGLDHLWKLGRQFMDGLDSGAAAAKVPAHAIGLPPMPFLKFSYSSTKANEHAMKLFCTVMLNHGVLLHPGHHWFTSVSMTESDVNDAVTLARNAFSVVADEMSELAST